jgi:tetratricopeptide (TPR) repeat protein
MLHVIALMLTAAVAAAPTTVGTPGKSAPVGKPTPADRDESYYHFSLGLQARLQGDGDTALAEYRKAQKLAPADGAIHMEIAKLLREAGRFDESLAEAREAVRLSPDDTDPHLVLAQLLRIGADSPERLGESASEYEAVVKLDASDGGSLQALAAIYGQLGETKQAIRALERYLELVPGDFDALLQIGSQYLAAGDSEHAAASLKTALELRPDSPRAFLSLGDVYARAEQNDQAILHYRKALELDPDNAAVRLRLGEILFRARRQKEAVAECDQVLEVDPHNALALELKGRSLRDLKQLDAASEVADLLLAQDPRDLKARYLKITILEGRRDFEAAVTALAAILDREKTTEDPREAASNDRVFLVHLGYAYQQLDRHAEAAEAFGRAASLAGEPDAALIGHRIDALVQAHDLEHAASEVKTARVRFPEDPDLATLEATVLREQGDMKGALVIVEKLRTSASADVDVLVQVADFYQKAKRYPDAEAALRQALAKDPKSLRVLFLLGASLERQGKRDEAESSFRETLQIQPDFPPALNYLGYMNADRGVRLEEAYALLEKAVALDPENGAYLDSLGWALYRLNRLEQAETMLRKAVAKQPKGAVVLDHLADTLERRGSVQEAVTVWHRALEGEDEDGELDRDKVQTKIHKAQSALDAQNKTRE